MDFYEGWGRPQGEFNGREKPPGGSGTPEKDFLMRGDVTESEANFYLLVSPSNSFPVF